MPAPARAQAGLGMCPVFSFADFTAKEDKMKRFIIAGGLLFLTGCTPMVHELKSDPAVVGLTGWWFSLG